jgi:cytoskeletal protein CcmA (bactofilin family)
MANKKNKKAEEGSLEEPSSVITPEKQPVESGDSLSEDSTLTDSSAPTQDPEPAKKTHTFSSRLLNFANFYFVAFLLLLLLGAGGIYAAIKFNDKNAGNQASKAASLTDKQLADLKNNTTLVGDSQQTLDIQGNSIFEGQVLMRNNLDVAGSIKVGGSLSLPAITVGGSSTFGEIHVNDKLTVAGNTSLQGSLTVQKGLTVSGNVSFGSISAGQINASSIQLTGDFVVSRHINVTGGVPSRSGGSALGAGGTATVSGTDTSGTVTINTGGGPPAGCFITMNFTQKFSKTPHVVISPSNSNAATLDYYTNRSSSNFSICTTSAPGGSTSYLFDYIVID